MALMTEKRVRHLPVLESDKVMGIISIGDLLKSIISKQKFVIDELEHSRLARSSSRSAIAPRLDRDAWQQTRSGRAYRPVAKRAMMTMVKTCIVPCAPTAKK